MHIEFVGAAQTVTGSMHLIRTKHATVLLDCGLYQGRRSEAFERNRKLPLPIDDIDAVVLSHAHIDHSGALPNLVKNGYDGPIYTSHATRDLCEVMLADAALIQASDARYVNKVIEPLAENYLRLNALGAYGSFFNIHYCSIRIKINGPAGSDILIPFGGPPDPSKGRCSENG